MRRSWKHHEEVHLGDIMPYGEKDGIGPTSWTKKSQDISPRGEDETTLAGRKQKRK